MPLLTTHKASPILRVIPVSQRKSDPEGDIDDAYDEAMTRGVFVDVHAVMAKSLFGLGGMKIRLWATESLWRDHGSRDFSFY
jgi:hypothetical protein